MPDQHAPSSTASPSATEENVSVGHLHAAGDGEYAGLRAGAASQPWTGIALRRVFLVVMVCLLILPVQFILQFIPGLWWPFAGLWHRSICRILGLRLTVMGRPPRARPVLYVANHISWVDILVLGGLLKNASFVAKAEVAGWGVFGALARLQRTLFIRRERRTDSARQREMLADRLRKGHSLILFPEGTSTDGMRVDPFKSSLFSVAERAEEAYGAPVTVQPLTISYDEINGIPMVRAQKPFVAWLGDVEIVSHLMQLLTHGRIRVTVTYHAPMTLTGMGDRKKLAAACEAEIREGLEKALRGEVRMGTRGHSDG